MLESLKDALKKLPAYQAGSFAVLC